MLKHYVEFLILDLPKNTKKIVEVGEREFEQIDKPVDTYGYRFFDRTVKEVNGELLFGEPKNVSPYVFYGKEYSLEELKEEFPDLLHIISKKERHPLARVIRTKFSTWEFGKKDDIVINCY